MFCMRAYLRPVLERLVCASFQFFKEYPPVFPPSGRSRKCSTFVCERSKVSKTRTSGGSRGIGVLGECALFNKPGKLWRSAPCSIYLFIWRFTLDVCLLTITSSKSVTAIAVKQNKSASQRRATSIAMMLAPTSVEIPVKARGCCVAKSLNDHPPYRLFTINCLRVCAALPVAMERLLLVGHSALLTLAARRANACNCCSFVFAIMTLLPSRH
jgi:hypothetical protein